MILIPNTIDNPDGSAVESSSSNVDSKMRKTRLPDDFVPNGYAVLCGRGKECFNYIGNRRFRVLVDMNLERYSLASTKSDKTRIVCEVVQTIRQGGGCFCRQENGKWYDVGDTLAREKVGALFRDFLHAMYKSSSKAKTAVRRQRRELYREIENSSMDEGSVSMSDDLMDSSLDGVQSLETRTSPFNANIAELQLSLGDLDIDSLLTDDDFDLEGDNILDFTEV